MALVYSRDDDARRITLVVEGVLTIPEWRAELERQIADGCWTYSTLVDARRMANVPGVSDVLAMLEHVKGLLRRDDHRGAVAVVVNGLASYGMGRVYGILAERLSFRCRTFRSIDEAKRWLIGQTTLCPRGRGGVVP